MANFNSRLSKLVSSHSKNIDYARREYILNILLLSWFILGIITTIINTLLMLLQGDQFDGVSPIILLLISCFYFLLLFLSKKNQSHLASILFLISSTLPLYYTSYTWGLNAPLPLLLYGVSVVMAGVLISSRASFVITTIHAVVLITLSIMQSRQLVIYNSTWQMEPPDITDGFSISFMLFAIVVIAWLSNRELEQALKRAHASEKALKKQRDLLEIKVEERTQELYQTQIEKMNQVNKFFILGKITSGLFHDLTNPLTAVSLNLEHATHLPHKNSTDQTALHFAIKGIKRIENFVTAVRKQIQNQEVKTKFKPYQEITQAVEILRHKANEKKIPLQIVLKTKSNLYGNSVKFSQIVTNLIDNALDATPPRSKNSPPTPVVVSLEKKSTDLVLQIQDFGTGIPTHVRDRIFEPLFTTKAPGQGTGLGLSLVKDNVVSGFGGQIKFTTQENVGTTFTASFPLRQSAG